MSPTSDPKPQPALLHWGPAAQRARERWFRFLQTPRTGKTGGITGSDCDEYQFLATREGGPGADLAPIDSDDNQDAGRKSARFYRICRVGALGTKHDFIVALQPRTSPATTVFACNGRR